MSGVQGTQEESELSLEVSRVGRSTSLFYLPISSHPQTNQREGLGGPSLLCLLTLTLVSPETLQAHSGTGVDTFLSPQVDNKNDHCSSLLSIALINTAAKSNLEKEGFISSCQPHL